MTGSREGRLVQASMASISLRALRATIIFMAARESTSSTAGLAMITSTVAMIPIPLCMVVMVTTT